MLMHLSAGVDVVSYRTQGDFTQICVGTSKGWVKTNSIGLKRMTNYYPASPRKNGPFFNGMLPTFHAESFRAC